MSRPVHVPNFNHANNRHNHANRPTYPPTSLSTTIGFGQHVRLQFLLPLSFLHSHRTMPATVFRREDLAPGAVLCDHCTAKCCRYFALPIDTPVDRSDYENIRWYMLHGDVSIFVDDGSWYLLIHNQCDHIDDQNRCGIYEDRPTICRSYSTDSCEFDDDSCYDRLFELPEQIEEYADAMLGRRVLRHQRTSLPVLGAAQ